MDAIRPVAEVKANRSKTLTVVPDVEMTEFVDFNISNHTARSDGNIVLLLYPAAAASVTVKYSPTDRYGKPYDGQEVTLLSAAALGQRIEGTHGPYAYELDMMKCFGVELKITSDVNITYKLLY